MKLTTQHIETVRKYFLTSDEVEKSSMQKSIDRDGLSSFIEELRQIYNSRDYDNSLLDSFLKTTYTSDYEVLLHEIKQDYYTHLAVLHNSGITNSDIENLVKSVNNDFLAEIDFQKELSIAFKLNEREAYKRNFIKYDSETEINPKELKLAFKLLERQQLKEQFQALESKASPVSKHPAPVIPFNWRRLAVAASLIGLILTTTFYLFDKNQKPSELAVIPAENKNDKPTGDSIQKQINQLLVNFNSPSEEKKVKVLKEASLGFAGKNDEIIIRTFELQPAILKLDSAISNTDFHGSQEIQSLLIEQKDSVKALENKYSFQNGTLSLHIPSKKDILIFKINNDYYIEISGKFYECRESIAPITLNKLTDKHILSIIRDIKYINSN